jgi:hypothetical protein
MGSRRSCQWRRHGVSIHYLITCCFGVGVLPAPCPAHVVPERSAAVPLHGRRTLSICVWLREHCAELVVNAVHVLNAPISCNCAEAATESVAIFETPENAAQVHKVQQACAGDLGKFFMMMIPLATQLVGSIIQKYGFEPNQQGAMAFVGELKKHQDDPDIKSMVCAARIRARMSVCLSVCLSVCARISRRHRASVFSGCSMKYSIFWTA